MFTKIAFLLAIVCFAMTLGGKSYGARPMSGGPGGIPNGKAMPGVPGVISGGGPGGNPGGLSQCHAITSFHVGLANTALAEIGSDYVLRRVTGVRTQVVVGTMYHLELHVAKTSLNNYCEYCDVRVWHRPDGRYTLEGHQCRIQCCF